MKTIDSKIDSFLCSGENSRSIEWLNIEILSRTFDFLGALHFRNHFFDMSAGHVPALLYNYTRGILIDIDYYLGLYNL